MPLHVEIKVNDTLLNQIHIGRAMGGTRPDDLNVYLVVDGDRPRSFSDWDAEGIPFTHRYGDGAEVCVIKALQALGYSGEQITRS
jgi:hypothetical protein